jgi:hypothetical protein
LRTLHLIGWSDFMNSPNDSFFVSRSAREIPKSQEALVIEMVEQPVENFRQISAWVLLGEPGAGKTQALKQEAIESGGHYIRIAEFIDADIEQEWQGKTLFLDGLDEVRASGEALSVIQKIRKQLKRLGCPPFRVSCRAADWHAATDMQDLTQVSPDNKIVQLQLVTLDEEDISKILTHKYGFVDPQRFIDESQVRGVFELLKNPQTLGLLVDAVADGELPETRTETFRLACEKQLEDPNPRYSQINRNNQVSTKALLDAAGQLSAIILLSNYLGVALERHKANEYFLFVGDLEVVDLQLLNRVVKSRLFLLDSQDRFVPSHRTIAEYLAARWLAEQLDANQLPRRRLLNLLLGSDGGVVAGLRGLYAWLAAFSNTARTHLIDVDPLAIIIYGDPSLLPLEGKRQLLRALHLEAKKFSGFHWEARERSSFGGLAVPELKDEFLAILESSDRSEAFQALVVCVLDILCYGVPMPELADSLLLLIRDANRWPVIRYEALKAWLQYPVDVDGKIALLDDVNAGIVIDADDQLAGLLLAKLYPEIIAPEKLIDYFHMPKRENYTGSYVRFWAYSLVDIAPNEHLPCLMDSLAKLEGFNVKRHTHYSMARMVDSLFLQALKVCGDLVSEEQIFCWLGIGADEYGDIFRESETIKVASDWFFDRSDKYKKILSLCFIFSESDADPQTKFFRFYSRLRRIKVPEDIGVWHLQQATSCPNVELTKLHLRECVNALSYQNGDFGLSLEMIEAWALDNPAKGDLLDELLTCKIELWHAENAQHELNYRQKLIEEKRERTVSAAPHVDKLRTSEAHVGLLNQLAYLWKDYFSNVQGESIEERFANYSENHNELLAAAKIGFWFCPERNNLPSVREIIALNIKDREHLIRLPCLIGMELRWEIGINDIDSLSDENLRKMVAFLLTYIFNEDCPWLSYLIQVKPNLVADVFLEYAKINLKAGKFHINAIYQLTHDLTYKPVAELVLIDFLLAFPLRSQVTQLGMLGSALKAAISYVPSVVMAIIEDKLVKKSMDSAQKVYWYSAAMLLLPDKYENVLWEYIGVSEAKANHLAKFLEGRYESPISRYDYPIKTLGRLIEFIAPHAEVDWGDGGFVSGARQRGDQIRGWINQLGANSKSEAAQELERLLSLPQLKKIYDILKRARHEQKIKQRESEFSFHTPLQVESVLANREPADISDLAALILDVLDDIGEEIRCANDDGFRAFWNVEKKQPVSQREENLCRDALLTRLRLKLESKGVDCQPEGDFSNDKRADLRLTYGLNTVLPMEIKKDRHSDLWNAWKTQLMTKYSIDPKSKGFGIYLVFWFGDKNGMPNPMDKGTKPVSAEELQSRLEAQIDPLERQRIFIRVLDVSWPK